MHWKDQLKKLEDEESFDVAIFFMQRVIEVNPNERDAYLAFIYLLGDTYMEPHSWDSTKCADEAKCAYYTSKAGEYGALAEKYFARSYFKFNEDPEYLFVNAWACATVPWFFGISYEFRQNMRQQAHELDPSNPIYLGDYYDDVYDQDPTNPELVAWAQLIEGADSPLRSWVGRGRVWNYTAGMVKCVSNRILRKGGL